MPPTIVKCIAKFRVGDHDLEIERGRWKSPPIPPDRRYCVHCKPQIEDEMHHLLHCKQYATARQEMLERCNFTTQDLTDVSQFKLLLGSADPEIMLVVGTFLMNTFKIRKERTDITE